MASDDEYDEDSVSDDSSDQMGLGVIMDAIDKKAQSCKQSITNIKDELTEFGSTLAGPDATLFAGLADLVNQECETILQLVTGMVNTVDEINDFVNPDELKMKKLKAELDQLRRDHAVALQRVEQGEGGMGQSRAQSKRDSNEARRMRDRNEKEESTGGKQHNRNFSLAETYAMFDEEDSDSDDSKDSDEADDNTLVVKKLEVTMESASYHCGVIKDVLSGMLSEIAMVSEAEQNLCTSVSDTIGGSIDRVQFALDNLYDQGLSEHDNWKEVRRELKKKTVELEKLQKETKQKLDALYSKMTTRKDTEEDDNFLQSMKEMGFRDVDAEIQVLERENTELVSAIERERIETEKSTSYAKNKDAQLRKMHAEFEELHQSFEECQNQLADAKAQISEMEGGVDIDEYIELKERLEYAKKTKMRTISFLDAEITRLKEHIYSIYETSKQNTSRYHSWTGAMTGVA